MPMSSVWLGTTSVANLRLGTGYVCQSSQLPDVCGLPSYVNITCTTVAILLLLTVYEWASSGHKVQLAGPLFLSYDARYPLLSTHILHLSEEGGGADTILYPSLLSRPSVDHNVTSHSVVISQEVRLCNTGEFWQCHGSSCCFSRYTFTPLFSCLLNDVMVFHTWPLCVWHISWQPYSQLWVVASFRRYIICSFLSEGWMSRSLDDLALYHEHLGSHWF